MENTTVLNMKSCAILIIAVLSGHILFAQKYTGKNEMSSKEKLNNEYCTGLFKTADGTILDLTNDNGTVNSYLNILEWLEGRVAGLQVYYTRYRVPVPFIRNSRASIFVDEIPVDPSFVNMLSVTDIAMVKIIRGPFVGVVGNGGGGTIAIYTLKGDDEEQ